ncbi:hypothetical protein GDO81_004674, partial [Engystomops pustulosus]
AFKSSSSRQTSSRNVSAKNYSEEIEDNDSDMEEVSFTSSARVDKRSSNVSSSYSRPSSQSLAPRGTVFVDDDDDEDEFDPFKNAASSRRNRR